MSAEQRTAAVTRSRRLAAGRLREQAAAREADDASRGAVPLAVSEFAEELASQLPHDAVVFDEALTCSPQLTRYLIPERPGHYFQTRGGSLGVGIPGAIGAKLAHPGNEVFGFTGDGGCMYTIQALWTAAHHDIGAKFVVCNNRSYRLLKLNIEQYWKERRVAAHAFPSSFDLAEPEIRFTELATSLGVPAVRVARADEIRPAIREALASPGPFLIDLVVAG